MFVFSTRPAFENPLLKSSLNKSRSRVRRTSASVALFIEEILALPVVDVLPAWNGDVKNADVVVAVVSPFPPSGTCDDNDAISCS